MLPNLHCAELRRVAAVINTSRKHTAQDSLNFLIHPPHPPTATLLRATPFRRPKGRKRETSKREEERKVKRAHPRKFNLAILRARE